MRAHLTVMDHRVLRPYEQELRYEYDLFWYLPWCTYKIARV
jgi:hypothetical protein